MESADVFASSLVTVILIALVSACAVTDVLSRRIPNPLLIVGLAGAILCHGFGSSASQALSSIFGLAIGIGMLLPFYALGGIGAGDVKLMGVVGALLGSSGIVIAGIATFAFGGLLGVVWILWRIFDSRGAKRLAHAAPLLQTGAGAARNRIPMSGLRRESMPYGPAIAAGTYVAVWQPGIIGQFAG